MLKKDSDACLKNLSLVCAALVGIPSVAEELEGLKEAVKDAGGEVPEDKPKKGKKAEKGEKGEKPEKSAKKGKKDKGKKGKKSKKAEGDKVTHDSLRHVRRAILDAHKTEKAKDGHRDRFAQLMSDNKWKKIEKIPEDQLADFIEDVIAAEPKKVQTAVNKVLGRG